MPIYIWLSFFPDLNNERMVTLEKNPCTVICDKRQRCGESMWLIEKLIITVYEFAYILDSRESKLHIEHRTVARNPDPKLHCRKGLSNARNSCDCGKIRNNCFVQQYNAFTNNKTACSTRTKKESKICSLSHKSQTKICKLGENSIVPNARSKHFNLKKTKSKKGTII